MYVCRFLFNRRDPISGLFSIFTKKTSSESWHASRKGVAPAFSSGD
jgi:hypothetical protein